MADLKFHPPDSSGQVTEKEGCDSEGKMAAIEEDVEQQGVTSIVEDDQGATSLDKGVMLSYSLPIIII